MKTVPSNVKIKTNISEDGINCGYGTVNNDSERFTININISTLCQNKNLLKHTAYRLIEQIIEQMI